MSDGFKSISILSSISGDTKTEAKEEAPAEENKEAEESTTTENVKDIPKISLIECKLETGRTHQIRVHMNFKGNPIIGDKSYGKSKFKFKK